MIYIICIKFFRPPPDRLMHRKLPDRQPPLPDRQTHVPDRTPHVPDRQTHVPDRPPHVPDRQGGHPCERRSRGGGAQAQTVHGGGLESRGDGGGLGSPNRRSHPCASPERRNIYQFYPNFDHNFA